MNSISNLLSAILSHIPYGLIALLGRLGIGATFLASGQKKLISPFISVENLSFNLSALVDFGVSSQTIFKFHDDYQVPFIPPDWAAHIVVYTENILPFFLFAGLFTRFSALILFGQTLAIQLFVYPWEYALHFTWMAVLLMLMAMGPGMVGLDAFLEGKNSEKNRKSR